METPVEACDDCCDNHECTECLVGNCCFVQPAIVAEQDAVVQVETPPSDQQNMILCDFDSSDILPPEQPPRLS